MQATAISASVARTAVSSSAYLRDNDAASFSDVLASRTSNPVQRPSADDEAQKTASDTPNGADGPIETAVDTAKNGKGKAAKGKKQSAATNVDDGTETPVVADATVQKGADAATSVSTTVAAESDGDHAVGASTGSADKTSGGAVVASDATSQVAALQGLSGQIVGQALVAPVQVSEEAVVVGQGANAAAVAIVPTGLAKADGTAITGTQAQGTAKSDAGADEAGIVEKALGQVGATIATGLKKQGAAVGQKSATAPNGKQETTAKTDGATDATASGGTNAVVKSATEKSSSGEGGSGGGGNTGDQAHTATASFATVVADATQSAVSSQTGVAQAAAQSAPTPVPTQHTVTSDVAQTPGPSAEARFDAANTPQIVTGITTRLLPDGGTMTIRLDPPELGAVSVQVKLSGGQLSASLQAESAESVRLMAHSISSLRDSLEQSGVTVDKLEVTHTPKLSEHSDSGSQDGTSRDSKGADSRGLGGGTGDAQSRQNDRNRQAIIDRLWARVTGDPLNVVI